MIDKKINKKLKVTGINLFVLFVLLAVVELTMYFMGYQKGVIDNNPHFKKVDQLIALNGYTNDNYGILKVNDDARNYAIDYIKKNNLSNKLLFLNYLNNNNYHATPYLVGRDFLELRKGEVVNPFSKFIIDLKSKENLTQLDQAYLDYYKSPINIDGFRSIAFTNHQTKKKKILLLGDSFTWGHNAVNKTNSFADNLSSLGYAVYNSGIVGTDIPQYRAITEQYLTKINPDVVIVNLYLGNDIAKHNRKVHKESPILYNTNAGNIYSSAYGVYIGDMNNTYNHICNIINIPYQKTNLFNGIMAQTRITTQLWQKLAGLNLIANRYSQANMSYWNKVIESEIGYSVNRKQLEIIDDLCKKNDTKLFISIIPELHRLDISNATISEMLDGFPFSKINSLKKEDYSISDGHFNEGGHRNYAKYLNAIIQKNVSDKK